MKNEFYYPSADGKTQIHATEWSADGTPKAILQISHGMVEYVGRYERFAEYLNRQGITVVGNDHLGHGNSVVSDERHGYFSHPDGNECLIADLHALRKITGEKYPGVPYFLLGHSMGSFLARQYVMLHGEGLDGAVFMGTGSRSPVTLIAAKGICRVIAAFRGWDYRSAFVNNLAFASNNKKFEPGRTPQDWLTRDEATVDAYRADPWCTFVFTLNGFYQMFRGMSFISKKKNLRKTPTDLPLLLISGGDDPIGDFGAGVRKIEDSLRRIGADKVTVKLYPGGRHEILNERNRDEVFADLAGWILAQC